MKIIDRKSVIATMNRIIESFGGDQSLANPHIIMRIQEELRWHFPDMPDSEMDKAREIMNQRKPKVY